MIAFLIIGILLILVSISAGILSIMSQNKTIYDFQHANEQIRKAKADLSTSSIQEYSLRRNEYFTIVSIHNKALSDQSKAKADAHMWLIISLISGIIGGGFFVIYFTRLPEDAFKPTYHQPSPPEIKSPPSSRQPGSRQ